MADKYIIEVDKIEGTDLWRAVGADTFVFGKKRLESILKTIDESDKNGTTYDPSTDECALKLDDVILVRSTCDDGWHRRHFASFCENGVRTFPEGRSSKTCLRDAKLEVWEQVAYEPFRNGSCSVDSDYYSSVGGSACTERSFHVSV